MVVHLKMWLFCLKKIKLKNKLNGIHIKIDNAILGIFCLAMYRRKINAAYLYFKYKSN